MMLAKQRREAEAIPETRRVLCRERPDEGFNLSIAATKLLPQYCK
jgi:hypothetical protein